MPRPARLTLHLDTETASMCDLRACGASVYFEHPSTRILCASYRINDPKEPAPGPVKKWFPGYPVPPEVLKIAATPGARIAAWNAPFEMDAWPLLETVHGWPAELAPARDLDRWECTMARAMYWGLPAKLESVGDALGLSVRKNMAGHALMMRMCRPRGFRADGTPTWWHEDEPARLMALSDYCDDDVEVETAVHANTPEIPDRERQVWLLDRLMNRRGVRVDVNLVNRMLAADAAIKKHLHAQMRTATGDSTITPNSVAKLVPLLQAMGSPIENLQAKTIAARLADPACQGREREILETRKAAARASTAKLKRLVSARNADGRTRNMLQYYGAGRTGRWAGRLVQPQNFPRGTIKNTDLAIYLIERGATPADLDLFFEDSAAGVLASCLRGTLVPRPGNHLWSADLAQIEARVVAWLAGQTDILDVFRSGQDVYVYTANKIGSTDRQLGKVLVLACGFGMGAPKFQTTAQGYNLFLPIDVAESHVYAWREANPHIVQFWWDLDAGARRVVASRDPKCQVQVGRVVLWRRGNTLLMRLPSGRDLVYRAAEMIPDNRFRQGGASITYWGISQTTKQWSRIKTYGGKLAENATQAVARDVMVDAMLAAHAQQHELILSVHDELIGEAPIAQAPAVLDQMLKIMRTTPSWAPGLPVGASGWHGPRYKKG